VMRLLEKDLKHF